MKASDIKAVQHLCKVARRILCYLPRGQESRGPRGDMEDALAKVQPPNIPNKPKQ